MKKVQILRVNGGKSTEMNLPVQFSEPIREDLIRRAVSALRMSRRQPYGADPLAGKRQGYHTPKRRKKFKTTYGKGISRIRRKHLWARGGQFYWIGAFVASATSGRKAFAPQSAKVLEEKINRKERRKAIRSALAASNVVVMDDGLESLKRTSEVLKAFKSNKLDSELDRSKERKIRAGIGTRRGRKYKTKVGPLIVVSKACPTMLAAENLQGVEVSVVNNLNAELLAPGGDTGRTTVWSKSALEKLDKEKLFI
jgi:large subunit ribosomal protein L4e